MCVLISLFVSFAGVPTNGRLGCCLVGRPSDSSIIIIIIRKAMSRIQERRHKQARHDLDNAVLIIYMYTQHIFLYVFVWFGFGFVFLYLICVPCAFSWPRDDATDDVRLSVCLVARPEKKTQRGSSSRAGPESTAAASVSHGNTTARQTQAFDRSRALPRS